MVDEYPPKLKHLLDFDKLVKEIAKSESWKVKELPEKFDKFFKAVVAALS